MQETKKDSEAEPLTNSGYNVNNTKGQNTTELDNALQEKKRKRIKYGLIGGAALIALVLIIVLPIVLTKKKDDDHHDDPVDPPTPPPPTPPIDYDTNPYVVDKASIIDDQVTLSGILDISQPTTQQQYVYQANQNLQSEGNYGKVGLDWRYLPVGGNNQLINKVKFSVEMLDYKIARFTLSDAEKERYSIPEQLVNKPKYQKQMRLEMLGFQASYDPNFFFQFHDVSDTDNVYITTEKQSLVFMDKFIQMDMLLPSQKIYGLGERVHEFGLNEGTWTMWASGQDSPYDDGRGRKGTYGVHPFALVQSGKKKDDYFGIYFRNSNAQSPFITYTENGKAVLSYVTIGGQIEIYFFIHGSAKDMIQQYHNIIGKPQLPPFWSLGWQQASWKYTNQSMVEDVIKAYQDNNMPLETVYFDIPYMNKYADFTVDKDAFPSVPDFVKSLHEKNQRLVVIIDAAISAEDTNDKYYKWGNDNGIFIQSAIADLDKRPKEYGKNLISQVWPNRAVFVDWLHEKTPQFWQTGLDDLKEICPFDGLWLDMSEPTTFKDGEIETGKQQAQVPSTSRFLETVKEDSWFTSLHSDNPKDTYNLPFIVKGSDSNSGNYDNMTISLNATHPGYNDETEYNLHSLYGHMMAWRTHDYMTSKNDERPFILTRSTFASGGRFTSHWLGDNWRSWEYMRYSISGMMNMNMFGIPHVGADVCGFFGEKRDNEMCLRWIQLSTFYPLARAHQNLTYKNGESDRSEPYYLDEPYKSMARESLYDRYSYLRHLYTCLYEVNQQGGTCIDPLFFHFSNDENLYQDYESSFMVGGAIKVSPVLDPLEGNTTFQSYFPKGKWASLVDFTEVIDASSEGKMFELKANRSKVNAHLRPGYLIPHQPNDMQRVKTTVDLLKEPIAIVANRDQDGAAKGTVLLDKGISRSEIDTGSYEYYQVNLQAKSLQFRLVAGKTETQDHKFGKLVILDAQDLQNTSFACYFDNQNNLFNTDAFVINYHKDSSVLEIVPNNPLAFNQIKAIHFGQQGEPNLCSSEQYQYKVKAGQTVNLKAPTAKIELEHMAGTLPNIQVSMRYLDQGIVNFKWTWVGGITPEGKRHAYEVPQDLINTATRGTPTYNLSSFVQVQEEPFQIWVKSRNIEETEPFFKITGMIYDQYLNWINVELKTQKGENFTGIFGLGERANTEFFYQDGVYTMWAQDHGTPDEDGKSPMKGMYGTHPFYAFKHNTSSWAGVFTNLAHAQDWWIKNDKTNGRIDISTIATGGVADIYVMLDQQNPEKIIERYYSIVGKPVHVPHWALGWNQCKWGYDNSNDLMYSAGNYTDYKIPLDVQWTDIDYMNSYKDFTYDTKAFGGLKDVISELHKQHKKFVPIIDAGIAYRPNQGYSSYDDGVKDDVFLKINGEPFIGKVWPNEAVFPDFFNPKTTPWWQAQLDAMHKEVQFDGLWLDMNEIANFCDGVCFERQRPSNQIQNQLPYIPGGINLETHGVSLDAKHANGYTQLDAHSFWGTQEVKATHEWFQNNNMRTFIIERSSFAGMGKFGSRWLGDNFSDAKQMGYSVSGIMLMNMFGIPLAGADICGFAGNTNKELCARWHTVGSFYPFSRNHNVINADAQEPWIYKDEKYDETRSYMDVMKEAIQRKYMLNRYFYSSLSLMSQDAQKPFYKPLFFAFPEDPNAYKDIIYNVMLGDSLKVSVNSDTLDKDTTKFYMPAGVWCDVFKPTEQCLSLENGEFIEMSSKAADAHVHLRQGSVVPLQEAKDVLSTYDLQQQPIDLHILGEVIDSDLKTWSASGVYYNDDGEVLNTTNRNNSYSFSIQRRLTGTTTKVEKIVMNVFQIFKATDIEKPNECNSVNMNDFVSTLYFYNADYFKTADTYTVSVRTVDGKTATLKDAKYDSVTRRIVVTMDEPQCLGAVQTIEIIAKA